jgi:6-phosphogluconolactonase
MIAQIDAHHFTDASALAQHVARRWLGSEATRFRYVALSGGRIARDLLTATAALAAADADAARRIQETEFFWADERCVPPEDVESNFRVAQETLFKPIAAASASVHRIPGELDPIEAVAAANEVAGRILPSEKGLPVFDLVFLGMGEDGHVASLFETDSRETGTAPYQLVRGPKPPNPRVTLTFAVLAAARQVWVLISGPGKELALRNSLQGKVITPLGRVILSRSATVLFIDDSFFEHRPA